jgi:hypothetical protein
MRRVLRIITLARIIPATIITSSSIQPAPTLKAPARHRFPRNRHLARNP